MGQYLYGLIIYPLEIFIETVFSASMKLIPSAGYAIILVSVAVQLLAFPMYKRADEIQEEERCKQKNLAKWITHIKKTFNGDERLMMLSEYYRQNDYQPWYSLRGILPLLLQVPFFIAAYHFLSNCSALNKASFYFLRDMGQPDGLLRIGSLSVNIMPIIMTVINIVAGMIYASDMQLKDRLQLFITAAVFLVVLYPSPSGLVFYWTLNNMFSLMKNIFMKYVKHSGRIVRVASVVFTLAILYKAYTYGCWESYNTRILMLIVATIGLIPVVVHYVIKDKPVLATDNDGKLFRISALIMSIVTGLLIPSTVISSSPDEFVIKGHYVNPLFFVLYCLTVSIGIFVLWGNILFYFNSQRFKKSFSIIMFSIMVCTIINYYFFSSSLPHLLQQMQYPGAIAFSDKEKVYNLAVIVAVVLIIFIVYKLKVKLIAISVYPILVSVFILSVYNTISVQNTLNSTAHIKDDDYYLNKDAHFILDKKGKNVIVVMLDRSYGPYIPYIMNEKPELETSYSGFTYYHNTISHGMRTQTGAPALFGGYDYTVYNVKDLTGDDYTDYINDSVKVMPKLFSENGFKCTVFDPPIVANLEDTTLEDYYHKIDPNIESYYADGVTRTAEEAERDFDYLEYYSRRNYIRHSFFISAPVFARELIYDDGAYLMQERADSRLGYVKHIEELDNLPQMTRVSDSGDNTFTIIENDVTHNCWDVELQMPDYTFEETADNSDYIYEWRDKLGETPGNRSINMYSKEAIQSYMVNMAAVMSIGKWLDYLKENDLYENTRIIVVGDHGYYYFAFDDLLFEDQGETTDLGVFTTLMMFKDFGDGEYSTSEEFMTNADVPTLAMKGLIKDPVNPYTGNKIDSSAKKDQYQYAFDNNKWLTVHDDVYDKSDWSVVEVEFSNIEIMDSRI